MHIGVAGRAIHRSRIEYQRSVAGFAIHFRMGSFQQEIRGVMPEDDGRCGGINQWLLAPRPSLMLHGTGFGFDPDQRSVGPSRRTMAFGTINCEAFPMGRLRRQPHCGQQQERDYLWQSAHAKRSILKDGTFPSVATLWHSRHSTFTCSPTSGNSVRS